MIVPRYLSAILTGSGPISSGRRHLRRWLSSGIGRAGGVMRDNKYNLTINQEAAILLLSRLRRLGLSADVGTVEAHAMRAIAGRSLAVLGWQGAWHLTDLGEYVADDLMSPSRATPRDIDMLKETADNLSDSKRLRQRLEEKYGIDTDE